MATSLLASPVRAPFTASRGEAAQPVCSSSHRVAVPGCHRMRAAAPPKVLRIAGRRGVAGKAQEYNRVQQSTAETAPAGPVTDATFKELVLDSPVPVLVDFWAPWCGPCRMIAPIVDEIAADYRDKLQAYKLNTDESPGVATEYGIRSIPTVMIFKDGKKVDTVIGAVPKITLVQTLEKYIED